MTTDIVPNALKRGDHKLLRRVLASNGGGLEYSSDGLPLIPSAQLKRLFNLGLVRFKPNHSGFIIHTAKTASAIEDAR